MTNRQTMIDETLRHRLATEVKSHYARVNKHSRGTLAVMIDAIRSFTEAGAAEAAASLAYYTLFSLFPLLIFLVSIGSFILESARVQQEVLRLAAEVLPSSQEFVAKNIQQILELRGTASLVAVVGLLWSATGVFSALARHINRAWHTAENRNFLQGRLVALGMVGVLTVLLVLSIVSSTAFSILRQFEIHVPFLGNTGVYRTFLWALISSSIPWLLNFFLFISLYRWVPNTRVKWSTAVWGAIIAAFGWEIGKAGFGWYLRSGLATFDVAYGSLGTVIVLMLWVYLSSIIVLFGAHLSAAVARHKQAH